MFQQLKLVCNQCKHTHTKDIQLISPEAYTNPAGASMLKQFWCEKCNTPLAFRIGFSRNTEKQIVATLTHQVDSNSVPTPRAPETGITIRPRQRSYKK
jgi:hypothetical protein